MRKVMKLDVKKAGKMMRAYDKGTIFLTEDGKRFLINYIGEGGSIDGIKKSNARP